MTKFTLTTNMQTDLCAHKIPLSHYHGKINDDEGNIDSGNAKTFRYKK